MPRATSTRSETAPMMAGEMASPRAWIMKTLAAWAVARTSGRLYAAIHRNVVDVFNEHGLHNMTPAHEGDPGKPKMVSKDQ